MKMELGYLGLWASDLWRGGGQFVDPLRPRPRGIIPRSRAQTPIMATPLVGPAKWQLPHCEAPINERALHFEVGPQGAERVRINASRTGRFRRRR